MTTEESKQVRTNIESESTINNTPAIGPKKIPVSNNTLAAENTSVAGKAVMTGNTTPYPAHWPTSYATTHDVSDPKESWDSLSAGTQFRWHLSDFSSKGGTGHAIGLSVANVMPLWTGANAVSSATTGTDLMGNEQFSGQWLVWTGVTALNIWGLTGFKTPTPTTYGYRALRQDEALTFANGEGIFAKNPSGTWTLEEHLIQGSSKSSWANDPWISTSLDKNIAMSFDSGNGVVRINLNKIHPNKIGIGFESLNRSSPGYHYSVWQQEISIKASVQQNAIKLIKKN